MVIFYQKIVPRIWINIFLTLIFCHFILVGNLYIPLQTKEQNNGNLLPTSESSVVGKSICAFISYYFCQLGIFLSKIETKQEGENVESVSQKMYLKFFTLFLLIEHFSY